MQHPQQAWLWLTSRLSTESFCTFKCDLALAYVCSGTTTRLFSQSSGGSVLLEVSKGELVVGVRDELPNETRASSARRLVELDCRAPGAEQRSIESSQPLGLVWAS